MIMVSKKNGTHRYCCPIRMQFHIDSIHSPHRTRNTIINACKKFLKFHLGILPTGKEFVLLDGEKDWGRERERMGEREREGG